MLGMHPVAQALNDQSDVGARELITDDLAPPPSAELDHDHSPFVEARPDEPMVVSLHVGLAVPSLDSPCEMTSTARISALQIKKFHWLARSPPFPTLEGLVRGCWRFVDPWSPVTPAALTPIVRTDAPVT
jgi:hypothetical protein